MERHDFGAGGLAASVLADGAELCSLRTAGHELIWQAGPVWPRHAPVLFPIVGRLVGDRLRHAGADYPMTQHGFARDTRFEWVERTASGCRLRLADTDATRRRYPFAFRLDVSYALADDALTTVFSIANPGDVVLPASIGAHPAFAWPLFPDVAKNDHVIAFEQEESEPIGRLRAGLLTADRIPTPVFDARLALTPEMFANDALILMRPHSRAARLFVPDGRGVRVSWRAMPQLGIWSKPGDFICIEPWHGYASPEEFDGDIADKPGMLLIPPGETREMSYSITPEI